LIEIEQVTSFRPNFKKLLEYCRTREFPLILVSAGLDFVIKHFLELKHWNNLVEVYAPKAECTVNGIKFSYPKLFHKTSVNFKDDLVRCYREQGKKVVYIGDGSADYHAARNADFSFAIKGSKLAELLKRDGTLHKEISGFQEVVETIEAALTT
jgi:2-hydroxy-3-keto-5-methylthiopentenyl-1-phosphate phosphatase